MSMENIFYLLITGAGLFLAIIAAYFIFKGLRFLLINVLEGVGFIAKILFKTVYLLFTLAISGVGLLGIAAFVESFLQNKPVSFWSLGIGIVLLFLGSNGFVRFIRNRLEFDWDLPSTNQRPYSQPNYENTDYGNYGPDDFTQRLNERIADREKAAEEAREKERIQDIEENRIYWEEKRKADWEADQAIERERQERREQRGW